MSRHSSSKLAIARRASLASACIAAAALGACGSDGDGDGDGDSGAKASATKAKSIELTSFQSAPGLHPSGVDIYEREPGRTPGFVFVGPKKVFGAERPAAIQAGAMMVDDRGRIRWFKPTTKHNWNATDVRVQRYKGKPVLTYWEGRALSGQGDGDCVILDTSYREIARIGDEELDLHECRISSRDTLLGIVYQESTQDLRAVGGKRKDTVLEDLVVEVDIETGKRVFEWSSLDHVDYRESHEKIKKRYLGAWNYLHINSVAEDTDGNLLVSARHTWTVYKLDRKTGEIIWRLGGKRSDFPLEGKAEFAWQHDAQATGKPNTYRIFDNAAGPSEEPKLHERSRALTLRLEPKRKTVELLDVLEHPKGLSAGTQGNVQSLPNGHTFVGWGSQGHFSEYDADGKLVFDGKVNQRSDSYRAYRHRWTGRPRVKPRVKARAAGRGTTVYASWNGSTEVRRWRVLAGPRKGKLEPVATAPWRGLETRIDADTHARYIAVQALDRKGKRLATSRTVTRAR